MRSREFATQLYTLHQNDVKNPSDFNLVSKWLISTLTDENTEVATHDEFPVIVKKLRDDVFGQSGVWFRRSRLYMSAKSILQHGLTIRFGYERGKILYKTIMLKFLVQMSNICGAKKNHNLDNGLIVEMMAKLARRINKLCDLDDESTDIVLPAINDAKKAIKAMRTKVNLHIDQLQSADEKNATLLPLTNLHFYKDVEQKVPKLHEHLTERNYTTDKVSEKNSKNFPKYNRHNFQHFDELPDKYFGDYSNEIERSLRLIDFENWALYQLRTDDNVNIEKFRIFLIAYAVFTKLFYEGDPLAISRMVLVQLKLIAVLDKNVCEKIPLLLKHRSGINPAIIKTLLLPQRLDMAIADELEEYFKERNEAPGPSLIEETQITNESFSSVYAAQNEEIQKLRSTILHKISTDIELLRNEWNKGREKVSSLRSQLPADSSHAQYVSNKWRMTCYKWCKLCMIENEIKKVKLKPYIIPLPEKDYEQNAVIFEKVIPPEIAHLRDVLYHFAEYCDANCEADNSTKRLQTKAVWVHSKHLSFSVAQTNEITSMNEKRQQESKCIVNLGTTTGSDRTKSIPVDQPLENFIWKNDYNCVFSMPKPISDNAIKERCTFKTQMGSVYGELQWMLYGTKHTENDVLAKQWMCPEGLSLAEYKNFGTLRASGHRLQLRKLYEMFETQALSFEEASVLSLVLQTIWECEEKGNADVIREAHEDFNQSGFSLSMVKLLDKFIETQKENWVHALKLLVVSFTAIRIMEINENECVADEIVKLIDKLRVIAIDWIERIQRAISDARIVNPTTEHSLRSKLALVAIAGAVTFFLHPSHTFFNKILQINTQNIYSAPRIWLQFVITLNNNFFLCEKIRFSILNMQMLHRIVQNIGVKLEPTMRDLIKTNTDDLFMLIKSQWSRADKTKFIDSIFDFSCPQMWITNCDGKSVIIDIVTGSFLVNYLPIARLPHGIAYHPEYQRIFQYFTFEVQPEDENIFVTVQKYENCSYKFELVKKNFWEGFIVTEFHEDGSEMELVQSNILANELPYLLVENYSHWWNKEQNTIDFRPKYFDDKHFFLESGIEYRLYLANNRLVHLKTKREMLDVTSDSYLNIVKHLSRLECSKFIHILLESPKIACIEMTRMNLKFKIDISDSEMERYDITSNEFSQMRVALRQKFGTLFGLNHGLLLENIDRNFSSAKLLLLPHGAINTEKTDNHVNVTIDTSWNLQSPPFHLYCINNNLRQLKPTNNTYSAWFYLAYLHAITSHGQIDPFTGISGTESALHILQSGFVWSSIPYDAETIQLLKCIARLSPERHVDNLSQTVEWPTFIHPHSAQDSFVLIVKKLWEDSQRLHRLHRLNFEKENYLEFDSNNLKLNQREYLRHLERTPNLRVSDIFIKHEMIRTSLAFIPNIKFKKNLRILSQLYHKHGFISPLDFDLWEFLNKNQENPRQNSYGNWGENYSLKGHQNEMDEILNHRSIDTITDLWISLYEAACFGKFTAEEFALIWSFLQYKNKDDSFAAILSLQTIEKNKYLFKIIQPPAVKQYYLNEGFYSKHKVITVLCQHLPNDALYLPTVSNFFDQSKDLISILADKIDLAWPCEQFNLVECGAFVNLSKRIDYIFIKRADEEINKMLLRWSNNQKLKDFCVIVQSKLLSLLPYSMKVLNKIHFLHEYKKPSEINWPKYEVNFAAKMMKIPKKFAKEMCEAQMIWNLKESPSKRSSKDWWNIYESIVAEQIGEHFIDAGIYRPVPINVLSKIASNQIDGKLKAIIGAFAISIAHEQREDRMKKLSKQTESKPDFDKETENEPFENWEPCEYPEWLLFEIEQNITIRRIQIEIAKRMINPPNIHTKHSTMQLNMGEGKTAVILPILASVLSNEQHVCQITVLKSLFTTNLKSLRQYLGGMLCRRIYIFPCRRDLPMNHHITEILDIYKECKVFKGKRIQNSSSI